MFSLLFQIYFNLDFCIPGSMVLTKPHRISVRHILSVFDPWQVVSHHVIYLLLQRPLDVRIVH